MVSYIINCVLILQEELKVEAWLRQHIQHQKVAAAAAAAAAEVIPLRIVLRHLLYPRLIGGVIIVDLNY